MEKLKFEGFKVGQKIKAFDFEPRNACPGTGCYVEGLIVGVIGRAGTNDHPYAHYRIAVTRDVWQGVDVARKNSRVAQIVCVPMETSMDYSGRVSIV